MVVVGGSWAHSLPTAGQISFSFSAGACMCVQLHTRGNPPGLQVACINKVEYTEELILFPSVQVESILYSGVPIYPCSPPLHAHLSLLTACPAVFRLNTGLGVASIEYWPDKTRWRARFS